MINRPPQQILLINPEFILIYPQRIGFGGFSVVFFPPPPPPPKITVHSVLAAAILGQVRFQQLFRNVTNLKGFGQLYLLPKTVTHSALRSLNMLTRDSLILQTPGSCGLLGCQGTSMFTIVM